MPSEPPEQAKLCVTARNWSRITIQHARQAIWQIMKNANIFVDVDLTLVNANGELLSGAREALQRLREKGCHLFLWSTAGAEYCRRVASAHRMTDFFEGFTAKPDIIIDDMPATCVTEFVYDVRQERSWDALATRIIEKHVD